MVEQQFHDAARTKPARRDEQRRAAVLGPRIHIGSSHQQQPGLFDVVGRPHESRRARLVPDVGSGAALQQQAHRLGVSIQSRIHEWCRAAGCFEVRSLRIFSQDPLECLAIAVAERLHETHGLRVRRHWRGVARNLVRPFGALIDPCLDGGDLFLAQRSRGRHLKSEFISGQPEIEPAERAVTRHDHHKGAAPHRRTATVEAEAVHLLCGPVTAGAVLLQQRLNLTLEIDFAGILCG